MVHRMSRRNFANGWGVSIICTEYSYGGRNGLFELAVLDKNGRIHYDNPVADGDVRGWLTEVEVEALADEVASWQPSQFSLEEE